MGRKKVNYKPSIFDGQDDMECFACTLEERHEKCSTSGVIDRHEIFYGDAYRWKSIKYSLWVNLCRHCHDKVHFGKDHSLDLKLKELGQRKFEEIYGHDKFKEEFDKNWL